MGSTRAFVSISEKGGQKCLEKMEQDQKAQEGTADADSKWVQGRGDIAIAPIVHTNQHMHQMNHAI